MTSPCIRCGMAIALDAHICLPCAAAEARAIPTIRPTVHDPVARGLACCDCRESFGAGRSGYPLFLFGRTSRRRGGHLDHRARCLACAKRAGNLRALAVCDDCPTCRGEGDVPATDPHGPYHDPHTPSTLVACPTCMARAYELQCLPST